MIARLQYLNDLEEFPIEVSNITNEWNRLHLVANVFPNDGPDL